MSELDRLYLLVGGVVMLSLISGVVKQHLWGSEPMAALLLGVAVGPAGLGLVHLPSQGEPTQVLEAVARLTVALSIMGVAIRLPDTYLARRWKPLRVMLCVAMPLMWLIASATAWLALDVSALVALWLGAVVTPTDPVVADAIVTGHLAERSVRPEVRHLMSAEAGANDGLAFLLVMLPITLREHAWPEAIRLWLVETLLKDVVLAMLIGLVAGAVVGWLVRTGVKADRQPASHLLAAGTGLVLAVLGGVKLIGADGLVAVFVAGLAFNWMVRGRHGQRQEEIQDVITRFFDAPIFTLLGLTLPLAGWWQLGWRGALFTVGVLALRRLPVVMVLRRWLAPVRTASEAAFVGWFGPVGAAAIVYATWARTHGSVSEIWVAGSMVVCASVVVHGITATPLTRLLGRKRQANEAPELEDQEHRPSPA